MWRFCSRNGSICHAFGIFSVIPKSIESNIKFDDWECFHYDGVQLLFGNRPTSVWMLRMPCHQISAINDHNITLTSYWMGAMASQITGLKVVYSTVYWGADQRKHQSSASLAFVRAIHRWTVNAPHKGPVMRKMFPIDDVPMLHNASSIAATVARKAVEMPMLSEKQILWKQVCVPF